MTTTAERQSRDVAEAAREREWKGASFLKDLFLGRFRLDLVDPYPVEEPNRPAFRDFYDGMRRFLEERVDPVAIDETGEYPEEVVRGLAELGAFGMKIPREYSGLGLTHPEYVRVMELVGSYDANVAALLSAHQAIGVPQPIRLFGTEEQKRRFLPRCAQGAISAFALTEPAVGSDPARLSTRAIGADRFIPRNAHLVVVAARGLKGMLQGTIGTQLIVVMARNPKTNRINAFVVEMDWDGVKVEHRSRFMGLKALANGVISFEDVKVPRENLIGREGDGLRVALVTLNTGRLTLPASTAGVAKAGLELTRKWANARVQWGVPIGKHEAVAVKVAELATTAFAMESIAFLVAHIADRPDSDIRLEAAAAKEWNTVRAWHLLDDILQIRGGRGYETERSLAGRGEPPIGVERMMRDARINLIFEGSSEIMHLFMAREAVDKHLEVAGAMIDPKRGTKEKLTALPKILAFYAAWYPPLWLRGLGGRFRYRDFDGLARHLRFVERSCRKLARESFHGMVVYQAKMERKQGFLFRCVDIVMELFAMAASVCHARRLRDDAEAGGAAALADLFCRQSRRRVRRLFRDLWSNEDARKNQLAASVMKGDQVWLEEGRLDLGFGPDAFKTRSITRAVAPEPERRRATPS